MSNHPSSQLSSFLQNEFKVGSQFPNPLIQALDNCYFQFLNQVFSSFVPQHSDFFGVPEKKRSIERLGFQIAELANSQIVSFHNHLSFLFENTEKLDALYFLSQLYFPGATVERGRNLSVFQIKKRLLFFQVPEKDHRNKILVITLPQLNANSDSARSDEFLFNAKQLVPHSFKILIRGTPRKKSKRILSLPFQLKEEKDTPCHISLN